jgi:hypothetical protein
MAESAELRRHLESALDRIPADAVETADEIAVTWPIATYTVSSGNATIFHAFLGKRCVTSRVLDVGAADTTAADGTGHISLNDFHCLRTSGGAGENVIGYDHPINVVATPRATAPAHLTAQAEIGPSARDVLITVFSWNANGAPLGGVRFNWRCTVRIFSVVG